MVRIGETGGLAIDVDGTAPGQGAVLLDDPYPIGAGAHLRRLVAVSKAGVGWVGTAGYPSSCNNLANAACLHTQWAGDQLT